MINHASQPKKAIKDEDLPESEEPLGPPVHFGAPPLEAPPLDLKHPDSYYSPHISEFERFWVDRHWFFLEKGFEGRERYRPGWIASWLASGKDELSCEDGLIRMFNHIIDARRRSDALGVVIKMIYKRKQEVDIVRYLSSSQLLLDKTNHTVRILGIFQDPYNPEIEHLVMPVLRPYDSPEFGVIGEVVDFVTQVLEGLAFMHSHGIAHNDLTENNIMMDGRPLCPQGCHPIHGMFSPDYSNYAKTLARIDHPVKYYFIDFGISHHFLPGQRHVVLDCGGADQDVPELRNDLYDPFKLDVYTLANIFMKKFYQKYLGLEFLGELVDFMRVEKPSKRPTAQMSLQAWQSIKGGLDATHARWRLAKPDESMSERVVLDAVAAARSSIHGFSRYFI
ncbi:kinase-like domain-containing protein [Crassisporium funariophilum]|nr:kinase-like domain-containing protein [Crassisporium funariophilum]